MKDKSLCLKIQQRFHYLLGFRCRLADRCIWFDPENPASGRPSSEPLDLQTTGIESGGKMGRNEFRDYTSTRGQSSHWPYLPSSEQAGREAPVDGMKGKTALCSIFTIARREQQRKNSWEKRTMLNDVSCSMELLSCSGGRSATMTDSKRSLYEHLLINTKGKYVHLFTMCIFSNRLNFEAKSNNSRPSTNGA